MLSVSTFSKPISSRPFSGPPHRRWKLVIETRNGIPNKPWVIGLHIGDFNAARHFPRTKTVIELELDHLSIACQLGPSFWEGQADIYDSRLSSWLELKRASGKLSGQSTYVTLVPTESGSFRVNLVREEEAEESQFALPASEAPSALTLLSSTHF